VGKRQARAAEKGVDKGGKGGYNIDAFAQQTVAV